METDDRLIPVDIIDIYPYPDAQRGLGAPHCFLVLLKGEVDERVVPITIGHFEGQALAMAIRKIDMPRPLPHDLLRQVLQRMGASVDRLVIHTLRDEVFHAFLNVITGSDTFPLDCRPSDGMIIATQLGVPVFISPDIFLEAGRVIEITESDNAIAEDDCLEVSIVRDGDVVAELAVGDLSDLDKLRAHLDWLIAQEAYEQAAQVRDQINKMEEEES
jgi:hypothetical protein